MQAKLIATQILFDDEGERLKPYYDHLGYPTVGIGCRCKDSTGRQLGQWEKLPTESITKVQSAKMLSDLLDEYESKLHSNKDVCDAYAKLNDVRKAVLMSIAHQHSFYGLLRFKRMWGALAKENYDAAADEIMDSDTARDPKLKPRMQRNSDMMRTGELLDYYK